MHEYGPTIEGQWKVDLDSTWAAVVIFRLWSDTGVYSFHQFALNGNDITDSTKGVDTIDGLPFWLSVYNTDGSDNVVGEDEVYAASRPILVTYDGCYDLLTGRKFTKSTFTPGLSLTYEIQGGDTIELTASAFRLDY